jgi:ABC-type transport system involved in multi-copper enzyme maturation permease subunit
MRGVLTIARLSFEEARHKRLLSAALVLGVAFLAVFGLGAYLINQDLIEHGVSAARRQLPLNGILLAAFYGAHFLVVMVAALVAVDSLAAEIGSGAVDTLCARPVRRGAVVLGKWLGCAGLVTLYAALLCGGVLVVARLAVGFTPPGTAKGLPLILLSGLIMMTLALAAGTRLSALASGVSCLGLYGLGFLGGWTEQIGTLAGNASARHLGILASLLVPCESLWQLAAHQMQPSLLQQVTVTPFTPVSVPSPSMVAWALGYLVAALLLAQRLFQTRDL